MAKQKSLKKNFIMNAILTMSSFIFPLITFPYVSRVLGPTGTGKVAFGTSLISYFSMVAQLGIPTYGIRACAKVRDDREALTRTAHELLMINLFMNVVSYALFFLAITFIPSLQADKTLYVVLSSIILLTSIGMEWLYKALEQYTYITIRSLIFKLIALVAMLLLIHEQEDYMIYGGITILASSASYIFNLLNAHRYIGFKPIGGYNLKRHLKPVAVFFAMSCATTVYTHLDEVMLGFMATNADVGYYHAAVRIKVILVSIVTSLGAVLLPRVSYYIEKKQFDEFRRITMKALNFVFLFATPLMLYFIFFAREGIFLLAGSAYEGSIIPMQIIMPTLLLVGITNILGIQVLVPLGREKVVLQSEIAGAITDVVLNAMLIPKFTAAGAAFGTLSAEIVVLIVQYRALKDDVSDAFRAVHYDTLLIALLAATVASIWCRWIYLEVFLCLLVSAVCFFLTYGLVLLLRRELLVIQLLGQGKSALRLLARKLSGR